MDRGYPRLTESTYAILLAANSPVHGYGIMRRIKALSKGKVVVGPGTLYGALKKLIEGGLIDVTIADDQKIYATTDAGRDAVQRELGRLNTLMEMYGEMQHGQS